MQGWDVMHVQSIVLLVLKAGGFAVVVEKDHRPDSIISIPLQASDVRVGM